MITKEESKPVSIKPARSSGSRLVEQEQRPSAASASSNKDAQPSGSSFDRFSNKIKLWRGRFSGKSKVEYPDGDQTWVAGDTNVSVEHTPKKPDQLPRDEQLPYQDTSEPDATTLPQLKREITPQISNLRLLREEEGHVEMPIDNKGSSSLSTEVVIYNNVYYDQYGMPRENEVDIIEQDKMNRDWPFLLHELNEFKKSSESHP